MLAGCHDPAPICLSDSFDEDAIDPLRWTRLGDAPANVVDGELRLTAPLGLATAVSGITSTEEIDLTGRSIEVRVVAALPADMQTFTEMSIARNDAADVLGIKQSNGMLVFSKVVDGTPDEAGISVDSQIDTWRIRADASNVVFETRAGTGEWTSQRMVAQGFSLDGVVVRLEAFVTGLPMAAGTASFDDLVVDQGACTDPGAYRHDPGSYSP